MAADARSMFQYRKNSDTQLQDKAEAALLEAYEQLVDVSAILSYTGHTSMLEKRQMKLQESFPSESTPDKALDRQLDGRLTGSACLDAQGIEETMVPTQQPPPSPSSPSPTGPSDRRHTDQCQSERSPDPSEPFSLRLAKAEERIRSLQSALTSSQSEVLNLQRQYDEERTSRAKEAVNLMVANIEKVNQRVEAAPIEADSVREDLDRGCISTQNGSSPGERVGMERVRLEMVIADRDREIFRLREEVRRLQLMLHEAQESTTNQIAQLEGQLARKIESIEKLQVRLQSQQDYEQIKTELRIFRAMKEASLNGRLAQSMSQLCSPLSERLTPMMPLRPLTESPAISVTRETEVKREAQTPVGLPVAMDTPPPGSPRPAASSQGSSSPRTIPLSPLSQSPDRPLLSPLIKPEPSPSGPFPETLYGPKGALSFEGSRSPSRASHSSDGGMMGEPWEGGGGGGGGGGSREEGEGELMETSEIALQVKEQLLRHNIGQRVFGHYVLGLSQGSVSEILARPKPWSKLTVKGKEPFLKMKHFLSSEQNILALRNIQVRQRGNITPRIRTPEMGSDDAIRNILEQAKKEIQREGEEVSPLKTSGSGPSGRLSAGRASSSGAGDSDDTIKAILEQARREMVAQQRHQALREMAVCHWGTTTTTTAAASSSSPLASAEPRPPSVKQEGASSSITASSPQLLQQTPLSVISPKDFVQNIIRKVKSEIGDAGSYQGGHWSAASSTSHPLTSVSPSLCSTTSSSSPFSNMAGQSSAWLDPWSRQPFSREQQDQEDALSSQGEDGHMVKVKVEAEEIEQDEGGEHLSPCSAYVTRPPKPIVPPLTPDQYDSFMHQQVDTALLTRQVKDRLAQKGICQRIFGEKVLGLSQGSVSDILSRPKPWSKLTQKGREPFIRMQLWMQGQLGQKLSPSPPNNPSLEQEPALASSSPSPDEERAGPLSEPGSLSLESSKENQQPPQQQGGPLGLGSLEMAPHHPTLSALDVQQLAILSPELDTLSITRRVKEVLNSNNLGQRLFGEMILGLTQGSVSDLLARPKPWSKLSLKGREPFVRMQLWLKDPQNIEKLREMKKMDNRAYLKRHHHLLSSGLDRDSPASASDMAPYLESSHPGQAKKARVVLATQEKETLKRAYQLEPYPSQSTIERLASQLGLKISTVINWFHNYRSRMRRDFEGGELLKADTLKALPGDLQEMRQMHCSQSPSKGDRSLSMPVGLVTVKQEPWELRQAEEESSEADAHPTKYISMGVQFAGRLEMKEESLSSPSPRLCSRVKQEVRGECGETSASLPKPDRLPGTRPVPHASEAQTFSHSSKEDTEPKANAAAAAAASASSSPTHTLPPVSPLPSSTTPTPLTSEAAAEQITVQQSLVAGHSTQQRSAKKANLDNIIHRLERAANREEMLEWEF